MTSMNAAVNPAVRPIASSASRRANVAPGAELCAELDTLVALAMAEGFHIEGLALAQALVDRKALERLRSLVFNHRSLADLRHRALRIEFIAEGPLPPELLLEPAAKSQPVFTQVVDYALCKSCRLCIQVCPKQVYTDDGFGKPYTERRDEECTGDIHCGQCVAICPERAISLKMVSATASATLFVQLENPYARADARRAPATDFAVANPLGGGGELHLEAGFSGDDLAAANAALDAAGFHPVLERLGTPRHFVDARDPEGELAAWAAENRRSPQLATQAVKALYGALPALAGVREGKYAFDRILHRIIDEVIHAGIDAKSRAGKQLLKSILDDNREEHLYLGSKMRPIGGLLPPGTSTAWKTPYGNEVPAYRHMEKCLGPECALCVTHCPEGNGGETSAIKMVPHVPLGTIPALVRGFSVYLLRLHSEQSGEQASIEDLSGREPFTFEVNADYCKSCGICISCCPHDVIEPAERTFDMGGAL